MIEAYESTEGTAKDLDIVFDRLQERVTYLKGQKITLQEQRGPSPELEKNFDNEINETEAILNDVDNMITEIRSEKYYESNYKE